MNGNTMRGNDCLRHYCTVEHADDLGWPITTLNHLSFYILRCSVHLRWS